MTNQQILAIAMAQSAIDCNCNANDFIKEENVIVVSEKNDQSRKYLELPFSCQLVSYGNNIVASIREEYREIVQRYLENYPVEHCFETPNLHALNEALMPHGQKICFMAEYFLPDIDKLEEKPCAYECRILEQTDFADLYVPEWSNALCEKRKHLDVLGVGAYDNGKLIALAACSADCDDMWQIGIDVLPEYRRQGVGTLMVIHLLRTMAEKADFATVSGRCDNESKPEQLYRKCGFTGEDVWHIMRK